MITVKIAYKTIQPQLFSRFMKTNCNVGICHWKRINKEYYEITFYDVPDVSLALKFIADFQ